jgi:hypothetical protein
VVVSAVREQVLDRYVLALGEPLVVQAAVEFGYLRPGLRLGKCTKDADHRYPPLLRARPKRPCCRCAAEQRNDVAPPHCLPLGSHPDHQLRSSKQKIASAEIGPMVNLRCNNPKLRMTGVGSKPEVTAPQY